MPGAKMYQSWVDWFSGQEVDESLRDMAVSSLCNLVDCDIGNIESGELHAIVFKPDSDKPLAHATHIICPL